MKVSPEFLKNFLNTQRKQYDFISLDDVGILSRSNRKSKRKFIVMTFDDGYRDNYEYALPIFEELRIPFAVYVTNSFPDRTAFLWWYALEDILQQNKRITLSDGRQFRCETKEEKEEAFLSLRQLIIALEQDKLPDEFKKLFCKYEIDYTSYSDTLGLSWSMIQEMANSTYCTVAAHTMNHKTLNKLPEDRLDYEIVQSKKMLEEYIKKPVQHFSYPFGTFNEVGKREIEFVKQCGFSTVCYSFGGRITKKNILKPLELPRNFFGELAR
jgi:peptidoglycan/xylan/chitin deacetylase (PgdA/CDA1 family)